MSKKHIISKPGLFGYVYHYDESGKCIGKSRPGLIKGSHVHFNKKGKRVATSRPGFLAKEVHHDEENEQYISSYEGVTGDVYFNNGTPVGVSHAVFAETEYTTLEGEGNTAEGHFVDDEYMEEENPQRYSKRKKRNQNPFIVSIIIFSVCCLLGWILILLFQ